MFRILCYFLREKKTTVRRWWLLNFLWKLHLFNSFCDFQLQNLMLKFKKRFVTLKRYLASFLIQVFFKILMLYFGRKIVFLQNSIFYHQYEPKTFVQRDSLNFNKKRSFVTALIKGCMWILRSNLSGFSSNQRN